MHILYMIARYLLFYNNNIFTEKNVTCFSNIILASFNWVTNLSLYLRQISKILTVEGT